MFDRNSNRNDPYAPPGELNSRRGTLDYPARISSPTLIELLVIVFIIGVLVVLLLPMVHQPRFKNTQPPPARVAEPPAPTPPAETLQPQE